MNSSNQDNLAPDWDAIRRRLADSDGRTYWRGIEELADSAEFQRALEREFPESAWQLGDAISRRRFLQIMAASMALAGLTGCSDNREQIVPYVRQPEELVQGRPQYFATALVHAGFARGVLAESHSGRPTKIEGNPQHPLSLGSTDVFSQASVLTLYDPDRSQAVMHLGQLSDWTYFTRSLPGELAPLREQGGRGLTLLTGAVASPTLRQQIQQLREHWPQMLWYEFEPASAENAREGARLAFGQPAWPIYNFEPARRILVLDCDLFCETPASLRYARQFAMGRQLRTEQQQMNRLYVVEPSPTGTGAAADHRLSLRPNDIGRLAKALAERLGVQFEGSGGGEWDESTRQFIDAVASDLSEHSGASLVVVGSCQPAWMHALGYAINSQLDNIGSTLTFVDPLGQQPRAQPTSGATPQTQSNTAPGPAFEPSHDLPELVERMQQGQVHTLVMIGCNPVYAAPADLEFTQALQSVRLRIHHGLYADETARLSHWHVPALHELESWADAVALDGTATIIQPLIEPLYGGRSAMALLGVLMGDTAIEDRQRVQDYWQSRLGRVDFEPVWRQMLHDGLVPGTGQQGSAPQLTGIVSTLPTNAMTNADGPLEIVFRPDPTIFDGRYANNAWLQECPRPITKLTWDNPALISPATAERYGLSEAQMVQLSYRGRQMRIPVWIVPGMADGCVVLHLGYGRELGGSVAEGVGFNTYQLRTSEAPWFDGGLQITPLSGSYRLACAQLHHSMEGRDIVRQIDLDQFPPGQHAAQDDAGHHDGKTVSLSLYPEYRYEGRQWGMAIDLGSCIGCNACVVACQAENNIPVVGKDEVIRGREMHWLRLDRYYGGQLEAPDILLQPMLCQHCEKAPCEPVCPVNATTHSHDGLNEMTYNRCIGTRYCSNNCPYKVRRFNFLHYAPVEVPALELVQNPDVTVRARGVMEKCTYCVQRIRLSEIDTRVEGRPLRDGELMTACQQACPTRAIVFGNINDPQSQVAQLKSQPHNYSVLAELGTQPRTSYLVRVRNPNPMLQERRV